MRARQILELSLDVAYLVPDTLQAVREVMRVIPLKEEQIAYLSEIRNGIDVMLKGAEPIGEQIRESNTDQKDQ